MHCANCKAELFVPDHPYRGARKGRNLPDLPEDMGPPKQVVPPIDWDKQLKRFAFIGHFLVGTVVVGIALAILFPGLYWLGRGTCAVAGLPCTSNGYYYEPVWCIGLFTVFGFGLLCLGAFGLTKVGRAVLRLD